MTATDEFLANNERYAATYGGGLPLPPSKQVAVVACMDARLNVYGILGLGDGEAHVIRNAGGVITDDEIRSLAISQRLLGTREIVLIHHTECGMLTFTDDSFKPRSPRRDGNQAAVVRRVLHGSRRRRPPVDRTDPFQPLHPPQGLDPGFRLRRRDGQAQRGELSPPGCRPRAVGATTTWPARDDRVGERAPRVVHRAG